MLVIREVQVVCVFPSDVNFAVFWNFDHGAMCRSFDDLQSHHIVDEVSLKLV